MAAPDGMNRMRNVARSHGGKCLTKVYTKLSDRYRFRCTEGQEWETVGLEVTRGAWCRICSNQQKVYEYRLKDGMTRLRACAANHGGSCLSQMEWTPPTVNSRTPEAESSRADYIKLLELKDHGGLYKQTGTGGPG